VRKISATFLFPVNLPPLKNGIIICDDDGTVVDLIDTGGKLKEMAGLEYYSGILAPGFVNAHCHLELSHLHGKIPEKTGIGGFLGDISQLRNKQPENTETTIRKADRMMWAAGIAAVGDISNSTASLATKLKSKIFTTRLSKHSDFILPAPKELLKWLAMSGMNSEKTICLHLLCLIHRIRYRNYFLKKLKKWPGMKRAFYPFTTRKVKVKPGFFTTEQDQLPTTCKTTSVSTFRTGNLPEKVRCFRPSYFFLRKTRCFWSTIRSQKNRIWMS
jgi:hypothetical protein